jgi:polar amino acid transport system ATP-binding protein
MDKQIEKALDYLLEKIQGDVAIQEYKIAEKKVKEQTDLMNLVEEIKQYNQEVVNFDHYGLSGAKKQAEKLSEEKSKVFERDLAVQEYRQTLFEANDLLQHITKRLTKLVNE